MSSGQTTRDYDPNDGYVPFKQRFLAWWEGVEASTLVNADDAEPEMMAAPDPNAIIVDSQTEEERPVWSEERIRFARRLWEKQPEDEVVAPGGADYSVSLFQAMELGRSSTVLDLSAGLGGGTRRAARTLNTTIDGRESDPDLAHAASALSDRHRMFRMAPIEHYDPDSFELNERHYDGILVRETLFRHRNKNRSFEMLYNALKPRGHLILTDIVLPNEAAAGSRVLKGWMERMPKGIVLWTADNYKRTFRAKGMDIKDYADESDDHRAMILKSWHSFVGSLSKDELTRDFVDEMMLEAEYWMLLLRALEFGALRFMRAHVVRT